MSICGDNACAGCEYAERCANSDVQTNEERIRNCSTEELVETIFDVYMNGFPNIKSFAVKDIKKRIRGWLKEVHKK